MSHSDEGGERRERRERKKEITRHGVDVIGI